MNQGNQSQEYQTRCFETLNKISKNLNRKIRGLKSKVFKNSVINQWKKFQLPSVENLDKTTSTITQNKDWHLGQNNSKNDQEFSE